MEITALIMAGGRGERFWPKSRKNLPKQFLSLTNDNKTMIQLTVERILPLVPVENIYIATNTDYKGLVREQLPAIPEGNILCEPVGRNTAPCIGLGAVHMEKRFGDALMLVLPSDHLIKYEDRFLDVLRKACDVAGKNDNLVTIGITPNYPETGYGYIRFMDSLTEERYPEKEALSLAGGDDGLAPVSGSPINRKGILTPKGAYPVECFVEKPNLELAKEYLESGKYLWNSGMFVWKVSSILKNMREFMPATYTGLTQIRDSIGTPEAEHVLQETFAGFEPQSIDYGIMEKAQHIYTIPGDFGWDDVGSWLAVERIQEKDEDGNVVRGNVVTVNSRDCTVQGGKKLLALVGLERVIIVDTEDATLICSKEHAGDIKKIIGHLKEEGQEEYL